MRPRFFDKEEAVTDRLKLMALADEWLDEYQTWGESRMFVGAWGNKVFSFNGEGEIIRVQRRYRSKTGKATLQVLGSA